MADVTFALVIGDKLHKVHDAKLGATQMWKELGAPSI
jgi:hypothetical protein